MTTEKQNEIKAHEKDISSISFSIKANLS